MNDGLVALPADARTREQLEWVAEEVAQADAPAPPSSAEAARRFGRAISGSGAPRRSTRRSSPRSCSTRSRSAHSATRLGHDDIRTTINIYGHLLPSVDDALADGLDALYGTDNVEPLRRDDEQDAEAA